MNHSPRSVISSFVAGLALLALSGPLHAAPLDARAVVGALHATLVEVMRDATKLGFSGREQQLSPTLTQSYDLPFVSHLVLGRRWKALDDGQRRRMIDTFTALTVATYASRFDDYSGERFEFVSQRALKKRLELVRTVLVKKDGDKVRLDYVMHHTKSGWRIVNVLADGVSEISIKRADYAKVMRGEGFDALLGKLAKQTANYAAKAAK